MKNCFIYIVLLLLINCNKSINIDKKTNTPKTIFFIITKGHLGGTKGFFDLWNAMKSAGHNVKIVAIPEYVKGKKIHDIDYNFINTFSKRDVIVPCTKDKCRSIKKYKPDYIFVFNPYATESEGSITEIYNHKNLSKIAKVMYIIYGPSIFHQAGLYDKTLPKTIDTVFVDSKPTKDIYVKDYGFAPEKVVISGYLGYKEMRNMKPDPHKKVTILWMPRWVLPFVGRNAFESGSTFLNYYHFFYNFAKENKNINLIIRPHENMQKLAISGSFLSQNDWNEIFKKFKKLPNVTISNHITKLLVDDIILSDIVIADGTSALAEAVIANKPIIYLSNGLNLEFNSNELSRAFKPLIYFAYSPKNIISFLDILRHDNMKMFGSRLCNATGKEDYAPSIYFKYHKQDINETCKGYQSKIREFMQIMDPVENPDEFIANYLSTL